jgi:hypothetical protein
MLFYVKEMALLYQRLKGGVVITNKGEGIESLMPPQLMKEYNAKVLFDGLKNSQKTGVIVYTTIRVCCLICLVIQSRGLLCVMHCYN